jgi:hypothetical protein
MSSAPKLIVATLAVLLCGACADDAEKPKPVAPPAAAPIDAGVVNAGPTVTFDPTSAHLDDGPSTPTEVRPTARRATRPIEIVLRSTPNAARVFVDGEDRGITPMLWQGETGEHVFTFVKKDHAMARYRFWAITSGIVHARLEPVAEEVKTGTPPPELVSPQVPAPHTILTPDASTPNVTPPDAARLGPSPTDAAAPPSIDAPAGSPVGPLP